MMRFLIGPIPENDGFNPDAEGWTRLRQVNTIMYAAIAFVMAIPVLAGGYWYFLGIRSILKAEAAAIPALVICLLLMVPIHELVHAMTFPGWLRDSRVMLGIWFPFGMWVCYDGPQTRNRLLLMGCMPLLVLSLLPLLVLFFLPPSAWTHLFRFLAVLHIAACTGDLQTTIRVMWQVPADAVLQNKGWQTYWRN